MTGTCEKCKRQKELVIHHLDLNKENNNSENLVKLCNYCREFMSEQLGIYDRVKFNSMLKRLEFLESLHEDYMRMNWLEINIDKNSN
jgi:hypothetical protein